MGLRPYRPFRPFRAGAGHRSCELPFGVLDGNDEYVPFGVLDENDEYVPLALLDCTTSEG